MFVRRLAFAAASGHLPAMPEKIDDSYNHRFHAGNVGDVWKHCVWVTLLRHLMRSGMPPLHVVETHAGAGLYKLGGTGEWTAGVGRVRAQPLRDKPPSALKRYVQLLDSVNPAVYPGSALMTQAYLRAEDRASFYETDPETYGALTRRLADDPRLSTFATDGLTALTKHDGASALFFVDPPYTRKEDWQVIPHALMSFCAAHPAASLALWYPIKSYTRPNAMLDRLAAGGVRGTVVELITTPIKLQHNRLNGSGMLLVNAPEVAISQSLAAAPLLGRLCATHTGHWTARALHL